MSSKIEFIPVRAAAQVESARELFLEYARELGIDLRFQGFEAELTALPGKYAPPTGELLLAHCDGALAGCVAVRPCPTFDSAPPEPGVAEMKRMFVRPAYRNVGLGRLLAREIIDAARRLGYACMRLDTLQTMAPAIALYRSLGFRATAPYYANPLAGVVYLELPLHTLVGRADTA